ncbi:methyltransferase [Actinocorallia sp. A-T 12471]|uniref:methyltransferase n=1 Tax=Actinocorallia sp. A-T 12471 TaxID=3089813 RepID=UPI0029D137F5|nr:methyltransferase [Actinocorallia sp. A-T 12471]MDX6741591.1 methyltransferase [Actinocorallia sp. A-T 12471]
MFADEDGTGAEVWAMAQLVTPMAVRVAATLRVADHIADGRDTADKLGEAVGADPDALGRLLRYLAKREVFTWDAATGVFGLGRLAGPLREGHPTGLRGWLDLDGIGKAETAAVELAHAVRTGEAAFTRAFGHGFWDDLAADPARGAAFDTLLGRNVPGRAPAISAAYPWGSLGRLIDVGGGDGSLLTELLTGHPTLRGVLVDQPETVRAAAAALARAGLAERAEVVEGSFFDPLPAGAPGYLLSFVLHNWNDRDAARILANCAQAAGADGRVFVVEKVRPDGTAHTGMDLRMLVYYGGKERGRAELADLGVRAGLRLRAAHPAGQLTVFEFTAA